MLRSRVVPSIDERAVAGSESGSLFPLAGCISIGAEIAMSPRLITDSGAGGSTPKRVRAAAACGSAGRTSTPTIDGRDGTSVCQTAVPSNDTVSVVR